MFIARATLIAMNGAELESGMDKRARLKRTLLAIPVLALAGVAVYAAGGFWIAPRILERELQAMAREEAGLEFAAETIAVNPFTLALFVDNVTLFRPQSTPVVTIGRLESRIRRIGFGERSVALREVVARSLEITDSRGRPVLTVPAATAVSMGVGSDEAALSFGKPRLEKPRLMLRSPDSGAAIRVPDILASLFLTPSADGDARLTFDVSGGSVLVMAGNLVAQPVLTIEDINGTFSRRNSGRDSLANVSLRGSTPGSGSATLMAEWFPLRPREKTRLEVTLQRFDLSGATRWLEPALGHPIEAGSTDIEVVARLENSMLSLDSALVINRLQLGSATGNTGEPARSLETAIALLEDPGGRIAFDLPRVRRQLDARMSVPQLTSRVLTEYVTSLVKSPFDYLAGIVHWPGTDLGMLAFLPGSAEIDDDTRAKLVALKRALALRPRLELTVYPSLDEYADREALARQQIRLHVNLASSAGLPGQPAPQSLDYQDPVVRDVLDEFAENRLSPSQRDALARRSPAADESYYRAVFDALVDNELVATPALVRLARYRAQAVIEQLAVAEDRGDRIRQAPEIMLASPASGPAVMLEVREGAL
jgi:hypothetical protein